MDNNNASNNNKMLMQGMSFIMTCLAMMTAIDPDFLKDLLGDFAFWDDADDDDRLTTFEIASIAGQTAISSPPRPQKKRRITRKFDRERAKLCVRQDYVGPTPLFRDRQFERVFRISRSNYDKIYNLLLQDNAYFRPGIDAVGHEKIDPH